MAETEAQKRLHRALVAMRTEAVIRTDTLKLDLAKAEAAFEALDQLVFSFAGTRTKEELLRIAKHHRDDARRAVRNLRAAIDFTAAHGSACLCDETSVCPRCEDDAEPQEDACSCRGTGCSACCEAAFVGGR